MLLYSLHLTHLNGWVPAKAIWWTGGKEEGESKSRESSKIRESWLQAASLHTSAKGEKRT